MLIITQLQRALHNRTEFDCGNITINNYFKSYAGQQQKANLVSVFVLTEESSPSTVMGFYTLHATSMQGSDLPQILTSAIHQRESIPVIELGQLGVDTRYQRSGYGGCLVSDAIEKAYRSNIGHVGIVVNSLSLDLSLFYIKLGFVPSPQRPNILFLPKGSYGIS